VGMKGSLAMGIRKKKQGENRRGNVLSAGAHCGNQLFVSVEKKKRGGIRAGVFLKKAESRKGAK